MDLPRPPAADEDRRSRRPRVREVSSRFMSSPIFASSSAGDLLQLNNRHQQQGRHPPIINNSESQSQPLSCADENRPDMTRSSETPLGGFRRKRPPAKLFKENGDQHFDSWSAPSPSDALKTINGRFPSLPRSSSTSLARQRTDTPTVFTSMDHRTTTSARSTTFSKSSNNNRVASAANTAAAKLVQSSGISAKRNSIQDEDGSSGGNLVAPESSASDNNNVSVGQDSFSLNDTPEIDICAATNHSGRSIVCLSPPTISVPSVKTRPISNFQPSMPESDLLPTMSGRLMTERNTSDSSNDSSRVAASLFYRSLNSTKMGAVCPPPHPSNTKFGTDTRKVTKTSNHQEDVHMLRLLHNRYLQWRFANAKAEVAMNTQRTVAERSLYSFLDKLSELHASVARKRTELSQLKMIESLGSVLDSQMPFLEKWTTLEEEYSSSLSAAVKALQDASLRIPVTGNVRTDISDLSEALNSATNMLAAISPHVESFLTKAAGVDSVISELAGVVNRERALIEESGDLLATAHMLQVEECSLRGQLIQLERSISA